MLSRKMQAVFTSVFSDCIISELKDWFNLWFLWKLDLHKSTKLHQPLPTTDTLICMLVHDWVSADHLPDIREVTGWLHLMTIRPHCKSSAKKDMTKIFCTVTWTSCPECSLMRVYHYPRWGIVNSKWSCLLKCHLTPLSFSHHDLRKSSSDKCALCQPLHVSYF